MPRFGSFCSDRVLRVPKLTSLRIVASMFLALISETIFGMSELPPSLRGEGFGRDGFCLVEPVEFRDCAPAGVPKDFDSGRPFNANTTSATTIFERDDFMRKHSKKNMSLRTQETLSTQTLKGNQVVKRVSFTDRVCRAGQVGVRDMQVRKTGSCSQ